MGDPEREVCYGQHVILKDMSNGNSRVEYIDPKAKILRFQKKWNIPLANLVGLPLGSTLRQDGRDWVRCPRVHEDDFVEAIQKAVEEDQRSKRSHREMDESEDEECSPQQDVNDTNTAQKLLADDVIALKQQGVSGVDLIKSLVQSSESFEKRTEYSKEKYIKKKIQRHVLQIAILKCDPVTIAEAYGEPIKIGGLRPQSVGAMLSEANVTAGKRVMVFDHSTGYLTMNVLARLGGHGRCFFLSAVRGVSDHIAKQANLTDFELDAQRDIPYDLLKKACEVGFDKRDEYKVGYEEWFQPTETCEKVLLDPDRNEEDKERARAAIKRRDIRFRKRMEAWSELQERQVDAILVCVDPNRVDASNPFLLANLLSDLYGIIEKVLIPGGRLSMFCLQLNPLGDLYAHMKARKHTWTNLRFEESMQRKICVLPGRSHPQMEASLRLFEGFHLSASRMVQTELEPTPPIEGTRTPREAKS